MEFEDDETFEAFVRLVVLPMLLLESLSASLLTLPTLPSEAERFTRDADSVSCSLASLVEPPASSKGLRLLDISFEVYRLSFCCNRVSWLICLRFVADTLIPTPIKSNDLRAVAEKGPRH